MARFNTERSLLQIAVLAASLAMGPALADDKGKGKGNSDHRSSRDNGKHDNDKRYNDRRDGDKRDNNRHEGDRRDGDRRGHFERRHNDAVRTYYDHEHSRGRCPPGLAKKHNGCMPPGQAKKWQMGQPLPRHVTYYQVPRSLVVQIGEPPAGYRYVRVSSDILLMATGTRMVVDAIQNLGRS